MTPMDRLADGLAALGFASADMDAFALYMSELQRWNRTHNLIGPATEAEIVERHLLDSALYARVLAEIGAHEIVDVGAGAGLPGVPVGLLLPDSRVTMIEPRAKRAAFLRILSGKLGRGYSVIESRAEDAPAMHADAAVTRALFAAHEFARICAHLVRPGGVFVLSKGSRAGAETAALTQPHRTVKAAIPGTRITRTLILVDNVQEESR